jgi:Ni,Fe-hydrogenase I cytochrome b subunit
MFMLERIEKNLERIIHYLITLFLVVFIASIIYGAILGDLVETESVGSVMCLSCMGLQQ